MRNKSNRYARVGSKALIFGVSLLRLVGTAAVLLIALAGTAAAQDQPGGPTTPPNLDHFYCYFGPGPIQPVTVTLLDQFDSVDHPEQITDLRIVLFCNPVQKTTSDGRVTQIQHPADHLAMYLINPQPIIPRVVVIRNQFGTQLLDTGRAVLLAVPSGKVFPITPPITPPAIPTDLDHFKCYSASGRALRQPVLLKDQFSVDGVLAGVLQPILFCNPVQKTVTTSPTVGPITTPITNPVAHLACYVTTRRPSPSRTLLYKNQFSTDVQQLTVSNPEILCVPSFKLRFAEPPPPTSLVPPNNQGDNNQGNDNSQ